MDMDDLPPSEPPETATPTKNNDDYKMSLNINFITMHFGGGKPANCTL